MLLDRIFAQKFSLFAALQKGFEKHICKELTLNCVYFVIKQNAEEKHDIVLVMKWLRIGVNILFWLIS